MGLVTQRVTNKHCLPVYDKPMILYPINTLVDAGLTDICVVTGGRYKGHIMDLLGDGKEFGCNITYAFQYGEGGIADALNKAKPFVQDPYGSIAVILGDNVFESFDLKSIVKNFAQQSEESKAFARAMVFLKEVEDPHRFGVAIAENSYVKEIQEKPKRPKSNLAVTGLYLYDCTIWNRIEQCEPSKRGELEITDVNNSYVKQDALQYKTVDGFWSDAGTPDSLIKCSQWVRDNGKKIS